MKIRDLIDELHKELNRGDEEIFVEFPTYSDVYYDFDLGIDKNGQPLIVVNKHPVTL